MQNTAEVTTEDSRIDPECHIDGYQADMGKWVMETFGKVELRQRLYRFGEESLELLQAGGLTKSEIMVIMDSVFSKPIGDLFNEVGGTFTTLTSVCTAANISLQDAANVEKARCWQRIEEIREKDKKKPLGSPLMVEAKEDSVDPLTLELYSLQLRIVAKRVGLSLDDIRPIGPDSRHHWPNMHVDGDKLIVETYLPIDTELKMFQALHELGHVHYKHTTEMNQLDAEFEACEFALTYMYGHIDANTLPLPIAKAVYDSISFKSLSEAYSTKYGHAIYTICHTLRSRLKDYLND